MTYTVNRKIAVTPFETTSVEVKAKSGFATASQKTSLTPLTVVFGNHNPDVTEDGGALALPHLSTIISLYPGDVVYVPGEVCKHPASSQILELEGKKFILIDGSLVFMVKPKGEQ